MWYGTFSWLAHRITHKLQYLGAQISVKLFWIIAYMTMFNFYNFWYEYQTVIIFTSKCLKNSTYTAMDHNSKYWYSPQSASFSGAGSQINASLYNIKAMSVCNVQPLIRYDTFLPFMPYWSSDGVLSLKNVPLGSTMFKGPFCDPNRLSLQHRSVDIYPGGGTPICWHASCACQ